MIPFGVVQHDFVDVRIVLENALCIRSDQHGYASKGKGLAKGSKKWGGKNNITDPISAHDEDSVVSRGGQFL